MMAGDIIAWKTEGMAAGEAGFISAGDSLSKVLEQVSFIRMADASDAK